ncbi:hypothetical protein J5N97_012795 [Dioscorea zingiberensis]|uniref:Uncharacterized protein n=1 Tax=Dioscorea zingiberensis TaxID=325984 RepID=A0A9D5CPZ6_9LILI|nr:hypothetical protein J5N97_012795 [Dioscorea zingiberensis]
MVTPYATVSLFSRATWSWMNPLIAKGNKSTLQLDDVPCLTPEHHAEKLLHSFQSHQPSPAARSNHLVTTLPLSALVLLMLSSICLLLFSVNWFVVSECLIRQQL